MSKKLKNQTRKVKINGADALKSIGESCEQYPTFSFLHLTTNKKHNFSYFGASQRSDLQKTQKNCLDRLIEISTQNWRSWLNSGKYIGCEPLDYSIVKFEACGISLPSDENIYVFRFRLYNNKDDGRILGFRKGKCPIYYIIGFDFDFSAYDNGS